MARLRAPPKSREHTKDIAVYTVGDWLAQCETKLSSAQSTAQVLREHTRTDTGLLALSTLSNQGMMCWANNFVSLRDLGRSTDKKTQAAALPTKRIHRLPGHNPGHEAKITRGSTALKFAPKSSDWDEHIIRPSRET